MKLIIRQYKMRGRSLNNYKIHINTFVISRFGGSNDASRGEPATKAKAPQGPPKLDIKKIVSFGERTR